MARSDQGARGGQEVIDSHAAIIAKGGPGQWISAAVENLQQGGSSLQT